MLNLQVSTEIKMVEMVVSYLSNKNIGYAGLYNNLLDAEACSKWNLWPDGGTRGKVTKIHQDLSS